MSNAINYGTKSYYGAKESNGLVDGNAYHEQYATAQTVEWNDKRLKTVTRLRLISDVGFPMWDVSYCYGVLKDGTPVEVQLPFDQLPRRGWKRAIIEYAKRDRVYANSIGILNEGNISTLV